MIIPILLTLLTFNLEHEINIVRNKLDEVIPDHQWSIKEIGNGNINYIYLADGGDTSLIVKKGLGFVKIAPETFKLSVERLFFEYTALSHYQKIAPERVPQIYFFDQDKAMMGMEYLTPHIILRKGLLEGNKYPLLANHLGHFLGKVLYQTSKYHLSQQDWEYNVSLFKNNQQMRDIILALNFTEPFTESANNHWTTPELDDIVSEIQNDVELKKIVAALKERFLTSNECLCHGDLHTGSILVTPDDTKVFDTEFATYGPIAFDIGMLFSNYLMASLAAKAYHNDALSIALLIPSTWIAFEQTFKVEWKYPSISVDDKLDEIWDETIRLMGVEIIRRTIGFAHNADFENIQNRQLKSEIEREALRLAKDLILKGGQIFARPSWNNP